MAILHALFLLLIFGPLILLLWGYQQGRRHGKMELPTEKHSVWPLVINSAILYALSYNIIYFIQELFLVFGKNWIGLTSILYHNNHNWEGSDARESLMQGTGAIAILILGIILFLLYLRIGKARSWLTLFVLWLAHHGLIQSLPQISSAPMDEGSDTGSAMAYLNLQGWVEISIAIVATLLIIAVSYLFSRYFLRFRTKTTQPDHPFVRFHTVWHAAILPAILGTILLFPYRIPPVDRYQMTFMLLIISIPSIFAFSWIGKTVEPVENVAHGRILIVPIILSLIVLTIFQLVLRPGVSFGPW